jgi:hypothetical protein
MTTPTEPEQLIELIAAQTRNLLQNHWPDIVDYLDGGEIKVGFSHKLSYENSTRTVETTISFARRIKDSISESIDTRQAEFPIEAKGKRR